MNFPKETLFNIDTVEFSVANADVDMTLLKAKTRGEVYCDGEKKSSKTNRRRIAGYQKRHAVHVRYESMARELSVEGSIFAYKSGQNVYTSPNLKNGCLNVLQDLKKKIGLNAGEEKLPAAWLAGEITLSRVDIAVNLAFKSDEQLSRVLKQVAHQLVGHRGSMHKIGNSIYWSPQLGTKYQIVMYMKHPQMLAKRNKDKSDDNEHYDQLVSDCKGMLRLEIRFRGSLLRELGLDQASAWDSDTARTLFEKYAKRLKLLNVLSPVVTKQELDCVKPKLRAVLALAKLGGDLETVYSKRTLQVHRAAFRALGIDIDAPPTTGEMRKLRTILLSGKRVAKVPAWLAKNAEKVARNPKF
ncbi:phage/plasmid replication protein, II/X family [Janthinobacterium sp.]|uniref:phage/plasmid replication protein, II/X family n=1 Tax=Janthinobacterium sp. TaxID=1871054 RepID=UPI0025C5BF1F|nr:phage/plasmid replication protein, II/X family [Janthinobacterium sp.]NBV15775.1 hypothetical protein [Janthinobacterium sp.]